MKNTNIYSLPQFENEDVFNKEDFNDAFEKIDKALSDSQDVFDELIINAGNSNAEIVAARGGEVSLPVKINKIDSSLSENANLAGNGFAKTTIISPKSQSGAFIVLTDDDARIEVLTKLKPISDEYGVPFTLAVPVEYGETTQEQRLTKEQLADLQNVNGWEMASHGYNHIGLHGATEDVIEYETYESKKTLRTWGLDVKNYIAAYGHIDEPLIRKIVSKYYNCAARVGGLTNVRPVQNYRLFRVPFGSFQASAEESTLEFYKAQVDDAIAKKGILIFMTHAHEAAHDETQQQYLKDTIAYAQSLGVPFGTLQDGYERYGNMVEVEGKSFIGNDGTPFGKIAPLDILKLGYPGVNETDIMLDTTPTTIFNNYRNKKVTVEFNIANNQAFPESKAGTLITNSFNSKDRLWQEWHPYQRINSVYYRYASVDGLTWSDFTKAKVDNTWYDNVGVLANGWTGYFNYSKNDFNIVSIDFSLTAGTTTQNTVVTTLPTNYKPLQVMPIMVRDTSGVILLSSIIIHSDGRVMTATGNTLVTNNTYAGTLMFKSA